MKHGSLVNQIYSQCGNVALIGEGATILSYSDRYPATVIDVFTRGENRYVVLQSDKYFRTDKNGCGDSQEYRYERDPDGIKHTYRIEKNGTLTPVYLNPLTKRYIKTNGAGAVIGVRERFYDFTK